MEAMTLDRALDAAMMLTGEQRRMLIEILERREIEAWREETARDAEEARRAFHAGELKAQTAEEVIADLEKSRNEEDDE